ncbi:hypothetical protein HF086_007663 [Spodoptera exigua]|uniref:Uncharacterized protein n=1 Tax=Spodoptera exigua TaxID=7107 RepID=A0A922M7B2_SPOEX|nr:hypothetical protein HF086_007663 [Spodoptera exigua]
MRCIRQLAFECDDKVIARVITEDIFVDDLITGDDDHHQLLSICQKTSEVLQSGCFLLRAKLYKKIVESLRLEFSKVYFWTDSTIVMGWLKMSPHLLKKFVQNRVSEVNELTGDSVWLHVGSKDNPADMLSRGYSLDLLKDCELWWNGPPYLRNLVDFDNRSDITDVQNLPELKGKQTCLLTTEYEDLIDFERYGSFSKLKRVHIYFDL